MDRFPHCFNWSDYSYNRHYKEILSMPDGATDKELSADSESNVNDSPCNKPQAIEQNNVLSADLLDIPQTKTFSDGDDIEDDFDISEDDFLIRLQKMNLVKLCLMKM